jgi:hypothetical protein
MLTWPRLAVYLSQACDGCSSWCLLLADVSQRNIDDIVAITNTAPSINPARLLSFVYPHHLTVPLTNHVLVTDLLKKHGLVGEGLSFE